MCYNISEINFDYITCHQLYLGNEFQLYIICQ